MTPMGDDVAILSGVYQQLETVQETVKEIRSEQIKIAGDLVSTSGAHQLLEQSHRMITLPFIKELHERLFGNGHIGLFSEHIACQEQVRHLLNEVKEIRDLRIWIRNLTVTTVGSIICTLVAVIWKLVVK